MKAFTKPPSPLLIMKRSRRLLEFDDKGKPIHPLVDQGYPVTLAKENDGVGHLGKWGACFEVEAMVCRKDEVLLVKDGRFWRFPRGVAKKGEAAEACAIRIAGEEAFANLNLLDDEVKTKEVYSNMNNFDRRTTRNAWVETTVIKVEARSFPELAAKAKWFKKSALPRETSKLHKILIMSPPRF